MNREMGTVEKDTDNTCPVWIIAYIPTLVILMTIFILVEIVTMCTNY